MTAPTFPRRKSFRFNSFRFNRRQITLGSIALCTFFLVAIVLSNWLMGRMVLDSARSPNLGLVVISHEAALIRRVCDRST